MTKKQKKVLRRILATAAIMVVLIALPMVLPGLSLPGPVEFVLYMVPYLVVGHDILRKAGKGICNRQVFDENFLMAVATVGAVLLGEYKEAVAVMLFYQIGELFQSYAVGKSRRNISALMDIRPDYANIEGPDGELSQVDPDEVAVGTVIVVKPGEKVPIDGVIVEGQATLNTSALTGESRPREVASGDAVISGCINMSGVLRIRTTKEFGESTVSKILELVENASSRKSQPENFISKFARVYTPAVCCGAVALAVVPPLVRMFVLGLTPEWGVWVYQALTFLVISCPCALVISIPLSFFAGIGGASKAGVLIKGSNYMESLAQVSTVVFDKTGTMTEGVFAVVGVYPAGADAEANVPCASLSEKALLELAVLAESDSNHPISKSLQKAYGRPVDRSRASDLEEIGGHGVKARVDGRMVMAGNSRLMTLTGIQVEEREILGTVVHVAVDGVYAGCIVIADRVKGRAAAAVEELKRTGVKRTVMLTGDIWVVAAHVAAELGIDEVHSDLLPSDKVTLVEELLREGGRGKLAFVGDGINDAPVLSRADVGIAMGALGSDAAIEAADIVLMDDDPLKIATAIRIARKCIRIVYQNIYFAIGVKLICLVLGVLGMGNMWMAIFADVGVMVLAVLNGIRTLRVD